MKRQLSSGSEIEQLETTDLAFQRLAALDQCFAILELIAGPGQPFDVSEISRRLGLNKSTVSNVVHALTAQKAIDREPERKLAAGTPQSSTTRAEKKRRTPVRTSKEEIQEKAIELFSRNGYHGTSTSEICQDLGISRPTLYWYFQDKEDILFSVRKNWIERSIQTTVARMKDISDPLSRLRFFIQEHTRIACLHPYTKMLINETAYLAQEHFDWVLQKWVDLLTVVRGTIRELKAEGRIRDVPEAFAAFSLVGMVMWPYNWFDHTRPEGIDGLIDTIEDIFFNGVFKAEISRGSRGQDDRGGESTKRQTRLQNEKSAERIVKTMAKKKKGT